LLLPGDPHSKPPPDLDLQAVDAATRLAVIRVSGPIPAVTPMPWVPRRAQEPRYLTSSDLTPEGVSLRPSYVGSLVPTNAIAWPGTVWVVPSGSDLVPGSFVFTITGEFVGLTITSNGGVAIVPGGTVFSEADRLLTSPPAPAGTIAVEVQALTEPIAAITGSPAGVVVTAIERGGPGWGALMVGDVIEGVDGRDLLSREQWNARMSRLATGETLALRVRRRGEVREISIEATPLDGGAINATLGLALRKRAGFGAEVTGVSRSSAASRAGVTVGDLITLFGDRQAPTPAQIVRSFAALRSGDRLMVAVTRGDAHFVTVIGR
jgi:S1-C subfamily serine protease